MINPRVEVEIARRYLVGNWQGLAHSQYGEWGKAKYVCYDQFKEPIGSWQTLPTRILTASPHLQGYDVPGEEIDRLKAEGLTLVEALEMLGMG